jgi:hypothetical protein
MAHIKRSLPEPTTETAPQGPIKRFRIVGNFIPPAEQEWVQIKLTQG